MKIIFFILPLFYSYQVCYAQKVGEIKEVKLILSDIARSGDAIQPNFITPDTSEIFSFNHTDWQDKHVSLFEFFHTYRDSCVENQLHFNVTMIYLPLEQYNYVRYEGYLPTGEIANQWVLTSIIREAKEQIEPTVYTEYRFNTVISTVAGDLNKDGLVDLAIITQDTTCPTQQYLLEIFFTQRNGDKKLIVSSIKAIEARFPEGRDEYKSNGYSTLSIHNGVLWIETGFIRGHMEHKFRYQNDRFELIGYSYADINAGQIEIIDYNLSTGKRIEKQGTIGDDTYTVTMDKFIRLNPLPDLKEFEPYENQLY